MDAYMGSLEGGPKPCSGAVELSVGGERTVILIWRDDFNICTHLCVKKKCGNRRDKKEEGRQTKKKKNTKVKQTNRKQNKAKEIKIVTKQNN